MGLARLLRKLSKLTISGKIKWENNESSFRSNGFRAKYKGIHFQTECLRDDKPTLYIIFFTRVAVIRSYLIRDFIELIRRHTSKKTRSNTLNTSDYSEGRKIEEECIAEVLNVLKS